ncbi:zinc ABC transporter ATP-binding protein AztA [Rothia halotolerans]|uniref:zinc ABC transporter ATP-binding protein AztA n=1 Tax=Rothia halotolerans TaxID=405770 RepID=UPI00101D8AE2|nr:zinc ABC transporter ATP-binding protein AztA [Rothia halotolerans]
MDTSLRLIDLSCRYGQNRALTSLSLEIPAGRTTAVIGSNGSGKSTLLSALAGTKEVSSGRIEGRPRNISFVVQRSSVSDRLPLTVRRTVEMGRWRERGAVGRLTHRDRDVVEQALEELGISDLAGRQLGSLSGGQRQRTLVAQGLAQQAELLLLDEPLAAVDEEAAALIAAAIRRQREEGVTVVIATHEAEQAAQADRVIRLEGGEVESEHDGVRR